MAQVEWTTPALNDLERILEYIELDDDIAARRLARRVFAKTRQLEVYPNSGSKPKELIGTPYRREIVGSILIYHRRTGDIVYIIHVRRGEMAFHLKEILDRNIGQSGSERD